MARYEKYLNVRIDKIVDRAIEKLAEHWGKKGGKRGYRSHIVRLAIVYAYLVEVRGIDPKVAE